MQSNLTQAARCALAELVAMYFDGHLSASGKRAIVDLHDALKEHGENMVDYHWEEYAVVSAS